MHYYKRNIGDYAKKAGRLSILQHGVYNLLIDACYDRERFPNLEEAIDWVWASTTEEREAVEFVLGKFFEQDEDGYFVQSRIADEIESYRAMAETNTRIARERETKRKGKGTTRKRSVNEAPPNQEPLTINQEPLEDKGTKRKRFTPPALGEIQAQCRDKNYTHVSPERFHAYYESNGWKVGRNKMVSWQQALAGWESREKQQAPANKGTSTRATSLADDLTNTSWAK